MILFPIQSNGTKWSLPYLVDLYLFGAKWKLKFEEFEIVDFADF